MESTSRTARQRAREEITAEILAAARAHLASTGPSGLSLRAVARDVNMVSSAVYRYFPSRDSLLTALLIEAYNELGLAAEAADQKAAEPYERWMAITRAVRTWSLQHPHDYALLYGSPVTGYAAPQDTITPATRVIIRLVEVVLAAQPQTPHLAQPGAYPFDQATQGAAEAIGNIIQTVPTNTQPETIGRTLMAWTTLFGTISFELWGHLVGSVDDHEAYFDAVASRLWNDICTTWQQSAT